MHETTPTVTLIARPQLAMDGVSSTLRTFGADEYLQRLLDNEGFIGPDGRPSSDAEKLIEYAGRRCYDDKTEILTEHGWVPGLKLDPNDRVATLNRTGDVVWEVPLAHYAYDYEGPMLALRQRNLDLVVTPEHRMWTQKMHEGGRFGDWHIATAETIGTRGAWRMRRGGTAMPPTAATPQTIEVPPHEYASGANHQIRRTVPGHTFTIADYAEFLGYVIAEGHVPDVGHGRSIGITQKDGDVQDRIVAVVERMGLPFHITPDHRKPEIKAIRVGGGQSFMNLVRKDCGGHYSYEKRVPRWLIEGDLDILRTFYEALWLGDGHLVRSGNHAYSTSSEQLADDVQEIVARLGGTASISRHERLDTARPMYVVRELESDLVTTRPDKRSWQEYAGQVWCVTTRAGIVMVRRNHKTVWCGNCYRSWQPGLNANVTRVRSDNAAYLANVLASGHGSVFEHAQFTFDFHNVSRVFTHELCRHRAGVAISQESLRYVRLTDLDFRIPEILEDHRETVVSIIEKLEEVQVDLADKYGLDDEGVPFHVKKEVTSALRRLAPMGLSTGMVWSANVRTLRHVIELRTAPGAEEEIRLVFDQVARIMQAECPAIFADFTRDEDGTWTPEYPKV